MVDPYSWLDQRLVQGNEDKVKTWHKLDRFVKSVQSSSTPETGDLIEGLGAVMYCMDRLSARRGPKAIKKPSVDSKEFKICLRYVKKIINHGQAVSELADVIYKNQRTAEARLAEMKPRAEEVVAFMESLDRAAKT